MGRDDDVGDLAGEAAGVIEGEDGGDEMVRVLGLMEVLCKIGGSDGFGVRIGVDGLIGTCFFGDGEARL